jgi:hypothetical protein
VFGKRNRIGTAMGVVVVAAFSISAGIADAASPLRSGWLKAPAAQGESPARTTASTAQAGGLHALMLRSDALNRKYHLGEYARAEAGTSQPDWLRALMLRSDALNRKYHLGQYARAEAGTSQPDWLRALMLRSDALNRKYHLGEYAVAPA